MIYYSLSPSPDPEERLEDAALWKAMHDEFGSEIEPLDWDEKREVDGFVFGRGRKIEWTKGAGGKLLINDHLPYWEDPSFLMNCGRSFAICDYDEAKKEVDRIHSLGLDAFVKSMRQKHFTSHVPRGVSLSDHLQEMAYSFLDCGKCLMVQEFIPMRYERRFVAIDRKIVTSSPIAVHLTPIDRGMDSEHFSTPSSKIAMRSERLHQNMLVKAATIAKSMKTDHAIIDLACSGCDIVAVEFNPARIGMFGLYACDVRAIAKAVRELIEKGKVSA